MKYPRFISFHIHKNIPFCNIETTWNEYFLLKCGIEYTFVLKKYRV